MPVLSRVTRNYLERAFEESIPSLNKTWNFSWYTRAKAVKQLGDKLSFIHSLFLKGSKFLSLHFGNWGPHKTCI